MGRASASRTDVLDAQVEALIHQAGGRASALRALLEHVEPDVGDGSRSAISLRLTSEEAAAVERAHTAKGMSRGEWLRALIRRQISDHRPLSRTQRGYLRRTLEELQALRREVVRMRAAVTSASLAGRDIEPSLRKLEAYERKLLKLGEAIHQGYLGEDAYWARLDDDAVPPAANDRA